MQVSSGQAEAFNAAAPSDFFQLLNLDLGASTADIKQSYRALQRLVHPDLIGMSGAPSSSSDKSSGWTLKQALPCALIERVLIYFQQSQSSAGDDANEVAVLLNIAYATLMDDALRDTYQSDVSFSKAPTDKR